MFKFMLIFYTPPHQDTFENSYQQLLMLIEQMPYVQRRQVIHVLGNPQGASHYHRILEVYYADQEQLNDSLLSPAGQQAGAHIQTFPARSFEMLFADVYEEGGGSTYSTGA